MKFTVLDHGCFKRTAVSFSDCAADSKAKPHAGGLARNKRLEKILAGCGRQARSVVGDHNAHAGVIVAFHEDPYAAAGASRRRQ
ncbi:hypothetical protein D3C83_14620 [compost metagenome]